MWKYNDTSISCETMAGLIIISAITRSYHWTILGQTYIMFLSTQWKGDVIEIQYASV